jgi:sialate O-acetylesterase
LAQVADTQKNTRDRKQQLIRRQVELALPTEAPYRQQLGAYLQSLEAWLPAARQALSQETVVPAMPAYPRELLPLNGPGLPTGIYNAMIHPLIPVAIRGAIWYQGESNVPRAYQYRKLFPALIRNWRDRWGQGDSPFLFVQLSNYQAGQKEFCSSALAELREAQAMTLRCRTRRRKGGLKTSAGASIAITVLTLAGVPA